MPERLAYDEAMLFSSIRLKILDPELKQGKVEVMSSQTTVGSVERPWGIEGGFAVVYKFRTRSGNLRALRCFRVPMSQDMQFRYERMEAYFQTHAPDITADFKYHDAGILVKDQGKAQSQAYPVIAMDWIEGETFIEKVDALCRKRDRVALQQIEQKWLTILTIMRQSKIAHGDLAAVNIMVRPDGQLVLVDYDGVYIPAFAGLSRVLLGQVDYQHPQMAQRKFDERMDDFSALVIYTALLALEVQPELWNKYAKRDQQGKLLDTNLLFTQQDFKAPQDSALMRELEQSADARLTAVVRELKRACQLPIDQVRFPAYLIDPDYEKGLALGRLESAIKLDDDELIANSWIASLEGYKQAARYLARVELARQRVQALQLFRAALKQRSIRQILANYDPVLDSCKNVTPGDRQLLTFARSFVRAEQDDDETLLRVVESLQGVQGAQINFTAQEQQAIALANRRRVLLQQLKNALQNKNIEQIAAAYEATHRSAKGLHAREKQLAEMAMTLLEAFKSEDDEEIAAAYESVENFNYLNSFIFMPQQQQRAKLALQRRGALARFRVALASKRLRQIASAYNPVLDDSKGVTAGDHEVLGLARSFIKAYDEEDDDALVVAYDAIDQSPYCSTLALTTKEQQRLRLAQQRREALITFQIALRGRRPREIAASYSEVLDNNKHITKGEREQLALARAFIQAIESDDDDALVRVDDALQKRALFDLTPQECEQLLLARRRQAALITFQQAIQPQLRSARQIVDAYDPSLLDTSSRVTPAQHELVAAAHKYLAMYAAVRFGILVDDDTKVRSAYDAMLAERFTDLTPDERKRIEKAQLSEALEEALARRDYAQAIRMASEIEAATGKPMSSIVKYKLQKAVLRFIKQHDLTDLSVCIEERADGDYALVRWRWPENELVQDALIVWSPDAWPPRLQNYARLNSGGRHVWVERKGHLSAGQCEFSVGPRDHHKQHIYVQAYTAILDRWDQAERWRFSDGIEPTSQAEVKIPDVAAS